MDKKLLRSILKTYDLNPRLESRLLGIAYRRIQELGLSGFDSQYRYIDELVEKFTKNWDERRTLSLNAPINVDSNTELHILVKASIESPDQVLLTNDFLDSLKKELTETEFKTVLSLLEIIDIGRFLQCYSSLSIPTLKERIEKLLGADSREARRISIGIPLRYVDTDTLQMRFGHRRFNGNPLDYFNTHPERYSGLNRSELDALDPGLYDALRRSEQIDLAIPCATRRFNEDPLSYFQSHPEKFANVEARSQLQSIDPGLYANLLKHEQIALAIPEVRQFGRPQLSPLQIEAIVAAFKPSNGTAREAAKRIPYSETTILKYWEQAGLLKPERSYFDDKLSEEEVEKVKYSFYSSNGVASRAAREVGHAVQTVNRIWRKCGLKNEQNAHSYNSHTQDEIDRIVALHEYYGGFVGDAARQTKRRPKTIQKYWEGHELPVFKGKPPVIRSNELTSPFRLESTIRSIATGNVCVEEARKNMRHKSVFRNGYIVPFSGYEITRGPDNKLLGIELLYNIFNSWPYQQKAA